MRAIILAAVLALVAIPIFRAIGRRSAPGEFVAAADGGGLDLGPIDTAADAAVQLSASVVDGSSELLNSMGVQVRKLFELPPAAAPYLDTINQAQAKYQLPEGLLGRVLYQESRFRQDIITGKTRSAAGAVGIGQFMPATSAELGVDPLNTVSAIDGTARYLKQLFIRFGDWSQAVAAYNWGQGNIERKGLAKAPAETREYVQDVLSDVGLI